MTHFLNQNRMPGVKSLTMVTDFWTAKNIGTKFIGLRVYYIDAEWNFGSLLLGTRHFQPHYGERDQGIREPFERWLKEILADFGLATSDFFGVTTDGGSDVKWMMNSGLNLNWEWCWPRLTNAATKAAFGMTSEAARARNPGMHELLRNVMTTVYQVRSVEVMGDLYAQLVQLLGIGKEMKLVDYKPHRFMGLTKVFLRIVKHWTVLEMWYEERTRKFLRDGKTPPNPFPLAGKMVLMEQLLSLLVPVSALNVKSQAEQANQVDVLLSVYKLNMTIVALDQPLRKYNASREHPDNNHPTTLLPLAETTRALLSRAFHSRFSLRYTNREVMKTCSYVWEIQLLLHPHTKSPDGRLMDIVAACGRQQRLSTAVIDRNRMVVKHAVLQRLKAVMMSLQPQQNSPTVPMPIVSQHTGGFFEDLSDFFSLAKAPAHDPATPQTMLESRVDEELERWFNDPILLNCSESGKVESVLHFWKRQMGVGSYHFLPRVARIVYAMPASSAQIERDFGVSGMMVTSQRASLSGENIDMCSLLNRNRTFIDVTQCPKLTPTEAKSAVPSNVTVNLDPVNPLEIFDSDWEHALTNAFSSTNMSMEL